MSGARPELSPRNRLYIPRHRYYELVHFSRQYPLWKKLYSALRPSVAVSRLSLPMPSCDSATERDAYVRLYFKERIAMVEEAARRADPELQRYLVEAVTEGLPYEKLHARYILPCSKHVWYAAYRRYFYELSLLRE